MVNEDGSVSFSPLGAEGVGSGTTTTTSTVKASSSDGKATANVKGWGMTAPKLAKVGEAEKKANPFKNNEEKKDVSSASKPAKKGWFSFGFGGKAKAEEEVRKPQQAAPEVKAEAPSESPDSKSRLQALQKALEKGVGGG
jgi:hypothetical protein